MRDLSALPAPVRPMADRLTPAQVRALRALDSVPAGTALEVWQMAPVSAATLDSLVRRGLIDWKGGSRYALNPSDRAALSETRDAG